MEMEGVSKGGEPKQKTGYPVSVFFIIGNEFCERFSYYGMKTVLTLYFVQYLYYDKDTSTMIYHTFSMFCYFTPIIGAIISDSLLGKFKTIFYISIIYVAGNVVLSVSAIPGYAFQSAITMLGLALIAFGTGGIKPCVAAFGGDQFGPGQELQLERFFSVFYMAINAGSLLSTIVTPILRADVQCWNDDCYALAFGVPAILMVVALILFLIGKPMYKTVPPAGNVIVKVSSCVLHALKTKGGKPPREHWLDHADDKFDASFISDIKAVLRVLVLYIPLPVFWALFDQQGSRWLLQATQMDGYVSSSWTIKPDQMQVVNPILIIACIPFFQYVVYPIFKKLHIVKTPLQRITVGGILAAGAFVVATFVELGLEKTLPVLPDHGFGQANLLSSVPCNLTIHGDAYSFDIIENDKMFEFKNVPANKDLHFNIKSDCTQSKNFTYSIKDQEIKTTQFYKFGDEIYFKTVPDTLKKPAKGECHIRIIYKVDYEFNVNSSFKLVSSEKTFFLNGEPSEMSDSIGVTGNLLVPPQSYDVYFPEKHNESAVTINLKTGGGYILNVDNKNNQLNVLVEPNSMSMLLQIPQYVVLTFGEIMFSITGLEFSYSQAPASMKSVLQAGWLMTVAFGNLIVVIVSTTAYMRQAYEFIMFAALMVLDMLIFAVMAYFYVYVDQNIDGTPTVAPQQNGVQETKDGHHNKAFNEKTTTPM